MNLGTHLKEGEEALAHIRNVALLRGVVAIAFAVVILVWPNIGLTALITLFGAFALVSGLATIAGAFNLPIGGGERAWLAFEGLLGIAVGIVVFVWPGLSALGLLYVAFGVIMFGHPGAGALGLLALIAAFAFVTGVMQIAFALELRRVGAELEQHVRPHTTAKPATQG